MELTHKRNIASWVLLAVFVPMLLISSLHIHHQSTSVEDIECSACVQHHCHGHLTQFSTSIHQCVLCQFLTLTFLSATVAVVVYYHSQRKIRYAQLCQLRILTSCGVISLRAPPVFSLL